MKYLLRACFTTTMEIEADSMEQASEMALGKEVVISDLKLTRVTITNENEMGIRKVLYNKKGV